MNDSSTVIKIENVSKRFIIRKDKSLKERIVNFRRSQVHKEDFWALRNVNLNIQTGTTVGLIGPNGSGKSTLLKTIGGILEPTTGTVQRRGRLAALLELGAGFHPDLTGRENVYLNASILGLSSTETDRLFEEIVDFSGIEQFIDTQVKFYSSGMYVRLAFAVAVHVDPDILLVDEVLAVGDEPFKRKCLDKIRSFQEEGRTIILVSHSLNTIGEFCDRSVVLNHGRVDYDGETAGALRSLRSQFEVARVEEQQRKEEKKRKEEALKRQKEQKKQELTAKRDEFAAAQFITSARLLGADGEPVDAISAGDSLRFEITVETQKELENWVVGMGIETPLGQVVFGTNTKRLQPGIPESFTGSKTVTFDLPDLRLGRGGYSLHASFGVIGDESIVRIPEAAKLDVDDGHANAGFCSVDASFSLR